MSVSWERETLTLSQFVRQSRFNLQIARTLGLSGVQTLNGNADFRNEAKNPSMDLYIFRVFLDVKINSDPLCAVLH